MPICRTMPVYAHRFGLQRWPMFQLFWKRTLPTSDACIFTGLQIVWDGAQISLQPRMPDPWAAHCYDELDNFPLKPWQSWGPPQLFKTTVRGLLCRCWYFSNSRQVFRAALWEVLVALVLRANFPWHFVKQNAMAWARTWVPKGALAVPDTHSF